MGLREAVLVVLVAAAAAATAASLPRTRTVDVRRPVTVANVERDEFSLAGILQRGGEKARPGVLRFMDVAKMRREGRAEWAEAFTQRHIGVGIRTDRVSILGEHAVLPDPTDKTTVLELAMMSYNAYSNYNETDDWFDIPGYDPRFEFGWTGDGLQGYIYVNTDASVAVFAIKGTSLLFLGQGGPTAEKDKVMDNLMFSCCCARVDDRWDPVCDCYTGDQTCSNTCLRETLTNSSLSYLNLAQELYDAALDFYPNATWWVTGHSLGGSLASLLAIKNGLVSFAYEAPGELLYGQRIGMDIDMDDLGSYNVFHYGNLADPIFLGTCQGRTSTCYISGYAMETRCHIGNTCLYSGGAVPNVNNHRIGVVIDRFITPNDVPICGPEVGCDECTEWTFI